MIKWLERMVGHAEQGFFFAMGVFVFVLVASEVADLRNAIEVVK